MSEDYGREYVAVSYSCCLCSMDVRDNQRLGLQKGESILCSVCCAEVVKRSTPPAEPENPTVARRLLKTLKDLSLVFHTRTTAVEVNADQTMSYLKKEIEWAESQLENPPRQYEPALVDELIQWAEGAILQDIDSVDPDCQPDAIITKLRDTQNEINSELPVLEYTVNLHEDTGQFVLRINDRWIQNSVYKGDLYRLANAIAASMKHKAKVVKK